MFKREKVFLKKKEEEEADKIFQEIMSENFQDLMKDVNIHIQESQWIPCRQDELRFTPNSHYNQTSETQTQGKECEGRKREELVTYSTSSIKLKLTAGFLPEITESSGIFKSLERKKKSVKYIQQNYPSRIKEKLRHFQTKVEEGCYSRHAIQEMLQVL